jgi:hypothetical protein
MSVLTTFRLEEGSRTAGLAVNPDASRGEIAARWQNQRPQMAVIDNLLTEDALDRLRRFCWGSTIWRKVYREGYLGAMPEHGFACPLLAQIADELRSTYPAILGSASILRVQVRQPAQRDRHSRRLRCCQHQLLDRAR